jgi:hypothetical protein
VSSGASPPTAPPRARRANPGGIALGLVIGILVIGVAALMIDGGAVGGDPFATSLWPVHPLWIVVSMGIGLLVALVLAFRAMAVKRGGDLGFAAVAVGVLPEIAIILGLSVVVVSNLPGM